METTPSSTINRLVMIFVSARQADALMQALNEARIMFTKFESTTMVFREMTVGLLVGVNHTRADVLYALIETHCQPRDEYMPVQFTPPAGFPTLSMIEARIGGALVYTLDVERFEQF